MANDDVREVTDAATLKAIAHPLRGKLLGALRIGGPATASELGRELGESSGSTSYHLRVLEKHGFIEADPEQPNARDKRWRAKHAYTAWRNRDFRDDPVGAEAAMFLRRRQLDNVVGATERYEAEVDEWADEWDAVSGHSDFAAELTTASVRELKDRFKELIAEYHRRDADAGGTERVRLYLATYPVKDHDF